VLSWVNLKAPDGNDYGEFMLSKEEPDPTHPGTAHHLCLETPDVPAAIATLKAKSYDPNGTRTELMEPKTNRWQAYAAIDGASRIGPNRNE
jgi:hypothetical protein